MYLETSDLIQMDKYALSEFAYRELNISLDTDRTKEWMVQQIYRLGVVEEAAARRW